MWHNVRARFDARGVDNVVWVMNYMGWEGWNCVVDALWPGNAYVDWVTWDPYPRNAGWDYHVGGFYNFLTTHSNATHDYLSKPWGLSEFGCVGSTQALAYQMYADAKRGLDNNTYPKLKLYSVWDQHTSSSTDVRVLYTRTGVKDPVEQARYNLFANDPLLGGSGSGPPSQDTVKPTAPSGLTAVAGTRQVTLHWTAATDNVGVAHYYVFRDTHKLALLGNVTGYTDTGLVTGTRYVYKVYAIDAAGNWSGPSNQVGVTAR